MLRWIESRSLGGRKAFVSLAKAGVVWHAQSVAMGVGNLANGTSDSHALRATGRATRFETL